MSEQQQPPRHNGAIKTVATDVVDVFRASPGLLFIIILNVIFLGGLGYLLLQIGDRRADEFKLIIQTMNGHYDDVMKLCFERATGR